MQFKIELDTPELMRRFLDCLHVEIEHHGDYRGEGKLEADGVFAQTVDAWVLIPTGEKVLVRWSLKWNPNGKLAPIEVSPSKEVNGESWIPVVEQILRNALVATINGDKEKIFVRQGFAYFGDPLDGDYYLPGFRLAPATLHDDMWLTERVIHVDQEVTAVSRHLAFDLGRIQAKRYASLLSVFLDIGLYEIPVERRWVLVPREDGTTVSQCLQLGYLEPEPPPQTLPRKGSQKPGIPMEVYRNAPGTDLVGSDHRLHCPKDIRNLIRAVNGLPAPEREAFLSAAALHQIAQVHGRYLPTLKLAYEVSAVDALTRSSQDRRSTFMSMVEKAAPGFPSKLTAWLYGGVRSGHFHAGDFPLGEFARLPLGPFTPPDFMLNFNVQRLCHAVLQHTLIRWLIDRSQ